MAFAYKTVGSTAATVATLLAFGASLWWQRTPAPVDIPRPQDEAEIMHATLERHYAMGRTAEQFTNYIPASVSISITGTEAIAAGVVAVSSVFDGVRYRSSSRTFFYTSWTPDTIYATNAIGEFTIVNEDSPFPSDLVVQNFGSYWYGFAFEGGERWFGYGDFPLTLEPDGSFEAIITVSKSAGGTRTLYAYVTNSPAVVLTNTVGFYPNATMRYPDSIRRAIEPGVGAWGTAGARHWLLPSNSWMTAGTFDGVFTVNMLTNVLETERTWWTNWVTLSTATWLSNRFYSVTNIVFTNSAWVTNILNYSERGTNTMPVNCWLGTNAPIVVPAKAFAFDRDQKPLYWSTNAYNDMARALAIMQWVRDEPKYTGKKYVTKVTWYLNYEVWENPTSIDHADIYGNNVPAYTVRTNGPFHTPGIAIAPTTTNTSTDASGVTWVTTDLHPSEMLTYRYQDVPAGWYGQENKQYDGTTNWPASDCGITITFVCSDAEITNNTCFIWTNGYFGASMMTTNTNTLNAAIGAFVPSGVESNVFVSPWSVPPSGRIYTNNIGCFAGGEDAATAQAYLINAATNLLIDLATAAGQVYPYNGYSFTNTPRTLQIPWFELPRVKEPITYRNVFQSLTNYPKHAPAR